MSFHYQVIKVCNVELFFKSSKGNVGFSFINSVIKVFVK